LREKKLKHKKIKGGERNVKKTHQTDAEQVAEPKKTGMLKMGRSGFNLMQNRYSILILRTRCHMQNISLYS
jgi:hypothetical protein